MFLKFASYYFHLKNIIQSLVNFKYEKDTYATVTKKNDSVTGNEKKAIAPTFQSETFSGNDETSLATTIFVLIGNVLRIVLTI